MARYTKAELRTLPRNELVAIAREKRIDCRASTAKLIETLAGRSKGQSPIACTMALGNQMILDIPENHSGHAVTPTSCLSLSGVWAAIRLISDTISTLPCSLKQSVSQDVTRIATNDIRHRLVNKQPNPDENAQSFWDRMMVSLLSAGNAFSEIVRDNGGRIVALYPLAPWFINGWHDSSGVHYWAAGVPILPSDLIHIKLITLPNNLFGVSPIVALRNSLGRMLAMESQQSELYRNAMRPGGILSTTQVLSDKAKMTALELREQLAGVVSDNKNLFNTCENEKRDLTQEEEAKFTQNAERAEQLKLEIRQAEKREYLAKEEAELKQPIRRITPERYTYTSNLGKRSNYNGALRAWMMGGRATPEDMRAADEWAVNPHSNVLELRNYGLDDSSNAAGAALVPITLYNKIQESMRAYGGLATKASVITTDAGNPLTLPDADYTTFTGSFATAATVASSFAPFGEKTLGGWLCRVGPIPVTMSLLQDAAFDVSSYVAKILGVGLARTEANAFVNGLGSGSSEPSGLVPNVTQAVSNTAYSYQVLLDIVGALDPAYYANASWLMSMPTYLAIAALVDGNGRPLIFNQLQALPQSAMFGSLLGFPIQIDQAVPSTTGNTTICFGDMSYFNIRRVQGALQLVRYNELYRITYNSIAIEVQDRVDSVFVGVGDNGPIIGFELLASS